jgi:signal transduction histidine kinase
MNASASLRRRLLLAGAGGIVVAALAAALLLGAAFERAALRSLDRRLDDDLDKLIALAEAGPDRQPRLQREPVDERYDRVFSGWYWAVGLPEGVRVSRSAWDAASLAPVLGSSAAMRRHAEVDGPRGQRLRVATQRITLAGAAAPLAFAVTGDLAEVRAEARDFRWLAGVAFALIALTLFGVMAVQVGFGLQPLRRVGATLERMRRDADERFDVERLPGEIAPLAVQVNRLLDAHALRVERAGHAAGDLAHALKTPLSALSLESEAQSGEFADRVALEVRRMQAAIERHLAGRGEVDTRQRTPVSEVADALTALMRRVHRERTLEIRNEVGAEAQFDGRREDLEEMLGNLLDNACKWAHEQVRVHATSTPDGLSLSVEDDGPGLESTQADLAMQRGVRLDERAPGSGFGLAIVQDLATAHGGALSLERSVLGGLCASIRFAPAD